MDSESPPQDSLGRSFEGAVRGPQGCNRRVTASGNIAGSHATTHSPNDLRNPTRYLSSQEAQQESFRPYLSAIQTCPRIAWCDSFSSLVLLLVLDGSFEDPKEDLSRYRIVPVSHYAIRRRGRPTAALTLFMRMLFAADL